MNLVCVAAGRIVGTLVLGLWREQIYMKDRTAFVVGTRLHYSLKSSCDPATEQTNGQLPCKWLYLDYFCDHPSM